MGVNLSDQHCSHCINFVRNVWFVQFTRPRFMSCSMAAHSRQGPKSHRCSRPIARVRDIFRTARTEHCRASDLPRLVVVCDSRSSCWFLQRPRWKSDIRAEGSATDLSLKPQFFSLTAGKVSVWVSPETHLCSQGSLKRVENCYFISPKEPWKSLVKAGRSMSWFFFRGRRQHLGVLLPNNVAGL